MMTMNDKHAERLRAGAWQAYELMVPLLWQLTALHDRLEHAHNALRGDTVPMRFPALNGRLVREWCKQARP
jgi:hypothetical protein